MVVYPHIYYIKRAFPRLFSTMNPPSPVYDPAPTNPFVEQPHTWNTDDVADTRVLNYLRRKLDRLKFFLDHPLMNAPHDQHTIDHIVQEIERMTLLLNKAHYN